MFQDQLDRLTVMKQATSRPSVNVSSVDKDVLREKERLARARGQQEVSPQPFFPQPIKVDPSLEDETSRRVKSTLGDFTQVQHYFINDPKHLIGISRSAAVVPAKGGAGAGPRVSTDPATLPPGHKKNLQNGQRKSSGHPGTQPSATNCEKENDGRRASFQKRSGGHAGPVDPKAARAKPQKPASHDAEAKSSKSGEPGVRPVSSSSGPSKTVPVQLNGLLPIGDVKLSSVVSQPVKVAPQETANAQKVEKISNDNVELETILQEMKLEVPTPLTAIDTPLKEDNKFQFSPKLLNTNEVPIAKTADAPKSSQSRTKHERKNKSPYNLCEDLAMSDSDDEEASIDKKLSDFPPDLRSPDGNENPHQSASSSSESSDDSEESSSESEESDSSACSNNSTPEVTAKTTTQSWGLANFMDKKSSPALALGNSLSQLPGGEKNGDSLVDDDSVNCILSKYPSHDIKDYLKSSSPEFLELEPSKGCSGAFHGLAPYSPPPPSPDVQQLVGCSPLSRVDDEEDSRSSLHSKWSSYEGKGKSRNRLFFNGSNSSDRQFNEGKASSGNTSKPFQETCSSPKVAAPDPPLPVPFSPKPSSKHKKSRTTESSEKRPKKSDSKTRDVPEKGNSGVKKKDPKGESRNSSDCVAVKESRNPEKHKAKAPVPPPPRPVEKQPAEPFPGKRAGPVSKQLKIKSREYVDSSDSDSDVDVVGCSREESSREDKCNVLPKPKVVTPSAVSAPVPPPPQPPRKPKSKSKDRSKTLTTGEKHKSSSKHSSLGLLNNSVLYPNAEELVAPPKMLSPLPQDEAEHKENDVPSVMVSIELSLLKRVPPYPPKLGILRPEDSIIRQRTECGAVTSSRGHLKEINREKMAHQGPRTPKRKAQQEDTKGHHKRPKLLGKKEKKIKEEDHQPKLEVKLERCDSASSMCSMASLKEPLKEPSSLGSNPKEPKVRRSVTPSSGSQKPAKVHREESSDRKRKFRKETVGEERPAKAPTYKESPAAPDCEPSSQDMQWDNQSIKSEVASQNGDVVCDVVNDTREHSRDWEPMTKVEHKSQLEYDTRQKNSDYYLIEAKKLKHKADREVDRTDQVMKYLEAVLYFILTGNAMENTRVDTDKIYTMYKETLHLIKYISSKFHKLLNSSAGSIDNKLAILSLRCQSLLHLKLYNLRQKDIKDIQKNLSDYQKTTAGKTSSHRSPLPPNHSVAPGRLKQPSPCQPSSRNGVPSPHSPTPSPAGSVASVGSQSSGYSSSELNGTQQSRVLPPVGGIPLSSAPPVVLPVMSSTSSSQPMVTIPQNVYLMFQRQQAFMANLSLCHELWEQADQLVSRIHVKDFFVKLDEQCGRLSLHSSFSELVHYVRRGLYLLKDKT